MRLAGIKGTIIVRKHCGTLVGTPSLWIGPTYYLANASAHISTTPALSGHQHGGRSTALESRVDLILD
jgi:hypothetical protein